ncbi:PREDICTED: F-box/kelch-repeat protein At3g06240-like [Nelumbo nucifera]|uniref:F-box/kelch-repeat protein At3g06240-like n=2 Tax=Nelumbo nucifera TaxID=4432 RepID=A0A1U8B378_NELNU|nr:PREDICTED: F-box/kelch-repeat protein At3g06240-like [Nelumbo nucifera]DAD20313.1 TPA_asm: hypothetical protein HUJ06_021776 [Nelumbo nucifera]
MEDLPSELVFDIFSRLPVKTLLQLRCVSKAWCGMVDDPCVAYMHVSRATERPSLLLLTRPAHVSKSNTTNLYPAIGNGGTMMASKDAIAQLSISHRYSLEDSFNGLLCFAPQPHSSSDGGLAFLLNPVRGDIITLPRTTTPSPVDYGHMYALGFDPSTKEYKVVHVFYQGFDPDNQAFSLGAEVYSLGTQLWRKVSSGPPQPLCGRPVHAFGALHWKVNTVLASEELDDLIITFDIGKEQFSTTPGPGFGLKNYELVDLVELNGCLSVVDVSFNTHIEVWVLKDFVSKQWIRQNTITINAPDGKSNNGHLKAVGLWGHGEILLASSNDSFFSYDPKTNGLRYVHVSGLAPDTSISHVCSHKASLVSLDAFGTKRDAQWLIRGRENAAASTQMLQRGSGSHNIQE